MEQNIKTEKCRFCGKEFYSLHENQIKQYVNVHEITCPKKEVEELKGDSEDEIPA